MPTEFWEDWLCVNCGASELRLDGDSIRCESCTKLYPLLDGIPAFLDDLDAHREYMRRATLERPTWYLADQIVAPSDDCYRHLRATAEKVRSPLLRAFIPRGSTLLDLGCGDGRNLPELRRLAERCYGTDYNVTRLSRASRTAGAYDALFMSDAKRLPAPDRFFDVVFCDQVLEHVHNPIELLLSARRVLKDEGALILGVPNEGSWYHTLKFRIKPSLLALTDHVNFFTLPRLAHLLNEAGFSVKESVGTSWGLPVVGDGVLAIPTRIDRRLRYHLWYNAAWEWLGRTLLPNQYFELYVAAKKTG